MSGWARPAAAWDGGCGPRGPARSLRVGGGAEAADRLHLRREDAIEVMEAEDLEDVEDGLVQVGQAQVAAVLADLLDHAHERAQARARDVAERGAVHDQLEPLLLQRPLDLRLEQPDGVRVD